MLTTITTMFNDMGTTIEINAAYDMSSKSRLKQMRMQKGTNDEMSRVHHDNFLRGHLQASICLNRIKQANRIGHLYWHYDREGVCEFTVQDVYARQTSETVYLEMLKQDPAVGGAYEKTRYGMGTELSCLSTFMAASVKDRMVGKYVLYNSNNALPGPSQPQMLALPDKESASYRAQYQSQNDDSQQYADGSSEQKMLGQTYGAQSSQMPIAAIGWDAIPSDTMEAAPNSEESAITAAAPKTAKKPRKKTERHTKIEESFNLEEMPLGQAVLSVKKRGQAADKSKVKKEKVSSKNNDKGVKSGKPSLTLVP